MRGRSALSCPPLCLILAVAVPRKSFQEANELHGPDNENQVPGILDPCQGSLPGGAGALLESAMKEVYGGHRMTWEEQLGLRAAPMSLMENNLTWDW